MTIWRGAIASAGADVQLRLEVERSGPAVHFTLDRAGKPPITVRWAAAVRIVYAHGGLVEQDSERLRVELPIAGAGVG